MEQKNKIGILVLSLCIVITLREVYVFMEINQSIPALDYLFLIVGLIISIIIIMMAYKNYKKSKKVD